MSSFKRQTFHGSHLHNNFRSLRFQMHPGEEHKAAQLIPQQIKKMEIPVLTACRATLFLLYFTISRNFPLKLNWCLKRGGLHLFPNRLAFLHTQNGSWPLLTEAQPTPVKLCVYRFIPVWCRNVKPTCLKDWKVKVSIWKKGWKVNNTDRTTIRCDLWFNYYIFHNMQRPQWEHVPLYWSDGKEKM